MSYARQRRLHPTMDVLSLSVSPKPRFVVLILRSIRARPTFSRSNCTSKLHRGLADSHFGAFGADIIVKRQMKGAGRQMCGLLERETKCQ